LIQSIPASSLPAAPTNTNNTTAIVTTATVEQGVPTNAYELLVDPLETLFKSTSTQQQQQQQPQPLHLQQQKQQQQSQQPTIATRHAQSIEELPVGITFLTLDRYVAFKRMRCGRVQFSFDPSRIIDLRQGFKFDLLITSSSCHMSMSHVTCHLLSP